MELEHIADDIDYILLTKHLS